MNPTRNWLGRFWALPLVVLLGVVIAVVIVKTRPAMEHQPSTRLGVPVSTLTLQQHPVRPSMIGYGEVSPDVLLQMRAEVSGRVSFVHPKLRKGAILAAGTMVLKIEDNDYRLALKKANASLAQNRANLKEHHLSLQDAELNLELAQQKQKLSEAELSRFERLLAKGSVAQSAVDTQRTLLLQSRQEVQSLQNQLDAMPYNLEVIKAQIEIAESEVETQDRNLQRTEIRLPFDARITKLSTEANQYVGLNSELFSAQTIDKVLINAQFSLHQMQFLSRGFNLSTDAAQTLLVDNNETDKLMKRLGLSARVRLVGNDQQTIWHASVERISSNLDPVSRTVGIILGVNNPYQDIKPGVKPPLIEGMYMEIELSGKALPYWVVPRNAVHQGAIYLVDAQQKLQRRTVTGYPQQQYLLLEPSIEFDDQTQLVTSDLFPAVDGMLLTPTPDSQSQQTLTTWLEAN
ncbi:MAG: hypothetical protein V7707_19540 [Motiliproteus sp.]